MDDRSTRHGLEPAGPRWSDTRGYDRVPVTERTRIKICGLSDARQVEAAVAAGVDALGFVLVQASPRAVSVKQARGLTRQAPAGVACVGLFVDETVAAIVRSAEIAGFDTVQLHGSEPPSHVTALLERGLRVVKALPFKMDTLVEADAYLQAGATLLWDTPPTPDAVLTGGSGHAFDWHRLGEFLRDRPHPAYLAGGLDAGNVASAVAAARPFGVDVSSGVERSRGLKDIGLIQSFCRAVRRADRLPEPAG